MESYKCDEIPMDSLITAAARALAAGDPLGALKRVALRDDAPALALRGIAMAQLGDLGRAKASAAQRCARAFGVRKRGGPRKMRRRRGRDRARITRLGLAWKALDAARVDARSAWRSGERRARAISRGSAPSLIGRLDEAERALAELDPAPFPPASRPPTSSWSRDRDAAPADKGGARGARRAVHAARHRTHPCTGGRGREARRRPEHARRALDRTRRGARLLRLEEVEALFCWQIEGVRRGRLPSCRAS
jgi:hypothetical protein